MPYLPGNQDNRGQYLAQGISQAGHSLAESLRAYGQNKVLAGQAVAKFEGVARANPELLQILSDPVKSPPHAAKAFAKLQRDGTVGVRDAALLAQFADTFANERERQQARQLRMLQLAQLQRQDQQAQANAAAIKFATMSPTASAIQNGATFTDLTANNVPAVRSAPEAVQRFIQAGGTPTPEINQLFNTVADHEAQRGATAARLAAAEASAGAKESQLAIAKERAEIERQRADTYQQRAGKTFSDGDERDVTINGVKRTVFFSRGAWLDKETGLPVVTEQRDMLGNVQSGVPNPVLFGTSKENVDASEPWKAAGSGKPAAAAEAQSGKAEPKYKKGAIYRDANGNRARWDGEKFIPL